MTLYRAQVVHKHRNGLPRDHFVNTFHFTAPGESQAEAEACAELARNFFTVSPPGGETNPLMEYLGHQVAAVGHEVRVYPVDEDTGADTRGPGQPPLWIEYFDHVGRAAPTGVNMPSEVAICLSYKDTTSGPTPPARRRGRLYIGPFIQSVGVMGDDAVVETSRPTVTIRNVILEAGKALADAPGTRAWVIYSRPFAGRAAGAKKRANGTDLPAIAARPGNVYPVTDLWVDDAWDTQRRRGERPTSRVTAVAS